MNTKIPIAILLAKTDFIDLAKLHPSLQFPEFETKLPNTPIHAIRDLEVSIFLYADGTTAPVKQE